MAPGVYFRCLLLGYFEGIDSERGIAWRAADSLSLRDFLGIPASKLTPDHSTISRTRRLIDLETLLTVNYLHPMAPTTSPQSSLG
jgi:transposase